jgi:hypothetical protein
MKQKGAFGFDHFVEIEWGTNMRQAREGRQKGKRKYNSQYATEQIVFKPSQVCLLAMKGMVQVYITSQRGMEVVNEHRKSTMESHKYGIHRMKMCSMLWYQNRWVMHIQMAEGGRSHKQLYR